VEEHTVVGKVCGGEKSGEKQKEGAFGGDKTPNRKHDLGEETESLLRDGDEQGSGLRRERRRL